jgi:cation diffusion facilitator CzcD-associated flavoprotein CzcO
MNSSTYEPPGPEGSGVEQVVVIGAGQAGLAVSHELSELGVDHVVLERARVGQSWRDRWDSFCLVTPNWTMSLPGFPYAGDDPDGFVPRDGIVAYLERYASSLTAPVREGVGVQSLRPPEVAVDRLFDLAFPRRVGLQK